jgi:hypothetical protein
MPKSKFFFKNLLKNYSMDKNNKNSTVKSEAAYYYEHIDSDLKDSMRINSIKLHNPIKRVKSKEMTIETETQDSSNRFKLEKVDETLSNNSEYFRKIDDIDIMHDDQSGDNASYFTVSAYDEKNIHCSRHLSNKKNEELKILSKTSNNKSLRPSVSDHQLNKLEMITKSKESLTRKKSISETKNVGCETSERPMQIKRRMITEVIGNIGSKEKIVYLLCNRNKNQIFFFYIDKPSSNETQNGVYTNSQDYKTDSDSREEIKHCEENHGLEYFIFSSFSLQDYHTFFSAAFRDFLVQV